MKKDFLCPDVAPKLKCNKSKFELTQLLTIYCRFWYATRSNRESLQNFTDGIQLFTGASNGCLLPRTTSRSRASNESK